MECDCPLGVSVPPQIHSRLIREKSLHRFFSPCHCKFLRHKSVTVTSDSGVPLLPHPMSFWSIIFLSWCWEETQDPSLGQTFFFLVSVPRLTFHCSLPLDFDLSHLVMAFGAHSEPSIEEPGQTQNGSVLALERQPVSLDRLDFDQAGPAS